jgi:hypothetical protein
MNKNLLKSEAERATRLLQGKAVSKVRRHHPAEVLIEFSDGTRLFVDKTNDGVELSITGAAYQVQRVLEWYPKEGEDEFLVGEEELKNISLEELRELFEVNVGETDDPLMYGGYPVKKSHLKRIQKAVSHKIDLSLYEYFVTAYQKEV